MTAIARHVTVTGRVQGVFFRAWTRERADALGVVGWVRNCPDGHVEVHIEGQADAVDQMLDHAWSDAPAVLRPAAAVTLAAHLDKLDEEGRLPDGVERPAVPGL